MKQNATKEGISEALAEIIHVEKENLKINYSDYKKLKDTLFSLD